MGKYPFAGALFTTYIESTWENPLAFVFIARYLNTFDVSSCVFGGYKRIFALSDSGGKAILTKLYLDIILIGFEYFSNVAEHISNCTYFKFFFYNYLFV